MMVTIELLMVKLIALRMVVFFPVRVFWSHVFRFFSAATFSQTRAY